MTDFRPQPITEANRQRLASLTDSFKTPTWPFPVVNGLPYVRGSDPVKDGK